MDERDMQLEANFQTQLLTQEGMCSKYYYITNRDFDKLMEIYIFFSSHIVIRIDCFCWLYIDLLFCYVHHAICRLLTFYLSFWHKETGDRFLYDFCIIFQIRISMVDRHLRLKICHYVIFVAVFFLIFKRFEVKRSKQSNTIFSMPSNE